MTESVDRGTPSFDDQQWARLRSYGVGEPVEKGTVLYRGGQGSYDMTLIESGAVEIVREAATDLPEAVVARHGPRGFAGELNLLTGAATWLGARVVEDGYVYRISPQGFRRLMDTDPELSDIVLQAFLARRASLRVNEAARTLEIVGSPLSATALALRTYVARHQLAHTWLDIDSPAGAALARTAGATAADLPVVITPGTILHHATPGDLARLLGLTYRPTAGEVLDLVVVGAGPAGLAASVYGASEGLRTLLLDAVATGGQAAASSRIENYLGFSSGISGADLTSVAAVQAQKFGVRIASPCAVAGLDTSEDVVRVRLAGDETVQARAVIVATGARYRSLPLERWAEFEGAGIYYAATEIEARACSIDPVVVVGGANSAGQAAIFLAARGNSVTLVVRGEDLHAGMSAYLADRIVASPVITVRTTTVVAGLRGSDHLEGVTLLDNVSGTSVEQHCSGLFCFIGAVPATDWLDGVMVDDHGFVLTDAALDPDQLAPVWGELGRRPLPFETSRPRIFAVGDVRAGSMKRVAAAVGEGASAVRSVHTALGAVGV